jgi:hypothetical protein
MNRWPERLHLHDAALIALLVLCLLAYLAGLSGGYLFDDFHHIVNNSALRAIGTPSQNWLAVAVSSDAGILRRPLSMLSFGLNVAWFGMSPFAFKAVNLFIHLVNGALVYAIGRRLAERLIGPGAAAAVKPEKLALLATGLWLLHPLHVSGVVYIVQRMNELAALFTLAGLLCYVDGRMRMLRGERALGQAILGVCVFGLLAALSKENGVLISAYALVIEAGCFRFEAAPQSQRVIKTFFSLSVALPLLVFAAYLATHAQWLAISYTARDFTLGERLLSEARILCDYLLWIFVPAPGWMGVYHDDIATSTGLLSPPTTALALGLLLALVAAAWKLRRRSPGLAFGVGWFLIGHAMESTILPLELVFEHRNYLPSAGLLLGIVCAVAPPLASRWPARFVASAGVALLAVCAGLTAARAASWGDPLTLAVTDARHHPDSSRSQYEAGRAIVVAGASKGERSKADLEAEPYFTRSAMLGKNQIAPATELMLIQAGRGPVPESAVADLAQRLRHTPEYTQASPFMDMLVTASEQKLSLTAADFATLVDAALANPHFPAYVCAMIMNNYGAYQFNIAHDAQGAVSWTLAAAAADPKNPYFQINLAKLALAVKQPDKARAYLDAAKQLNGAGLYDTEIDALQRQIMQ